jgi:putative addiction module killer protein
MAITVKKYVRADLSVPFQHWYDGLNGLAQAKVASAIFRIQDGNLSRIKWFAGIGEYVINWGPGYRIYLAKHSSDIATGRRDQAAATDRHYAC